MAKLLLNSNGKALMDENGKVYKAPPSSLKKLLDATKSAARLFNFYNGESVDGLISYSDTENVTSTGAMFDNCTNLQTIPQIDTRNVTHMNSMFMSCNNLQTIPQLDTKNVTSMEYIFSGCFKLQSVPQLNTSKILSTYHMFYSCKNLQSVPQLDTSQVINMHEMFFGCSNLQSISLSDTSKVTDMYRMCYMCTKLQTISPLNMIKVKDTTFMFYGCAALTNLTLFNIKVNLEIGSATGTPWGHLLTLDSLINTIKELVNVGSSSKLTMGTANLEKIANVYVRRTTTGDIPICLSNNSNIDLAKAPCEVCESTDDGAMTLKDYAKLKNWYLL